MPGARVLTVAVLVLGAVCAMPALSVAQDPGVEAPAVPPLQAAPDKADPGDKPQADPDPSQPAPAEAAPQPAAAPRASGGGAHAAASATVSMGDNFFSPATVSIAVGDTVTWKNNGQAAHNVTADSFNSGTVNPGGSFSHSFNSAGTFSYVCTFHAGMTGKVRVLSASGGGGGSASSGSSGSSQSEAAAVASPGAAGTSTSLPATGLGAGVLALIGLALIAGGLLGRFLVRLETGETKPRRGPIFRIPIF